jgi:phosphoribosylformylglycinamidine synthase subunit PurL
VLRFGIGARVVLDEMQERDGVDTATALFSESTARVIVTVRREDDVRFQGLCDGRGFPVLRIGVTDASSGSLEVQGAFEATVDELRGTHASTLPSRFGDVVAEDVTEGYVGRGPLAADGTFSPRTDG